MSLSEHEALQPFMALGAPQGSQPAYFDMHADDVVFREGGNIVTAGDVRALQAFMVSHGVEPRDRMTLLMSKIPEGTKQ